MKVLYSVTRHHLYAKDSELNVHILYTSAVEITEASQVK